MTESDAQRDTTSATTAGVGPRRANSERTMCPPHLGQASHADGDRRPAPRILEVTFNGVGLVIGLYFLAISLTPSLLPRAAYVQGINSGVAMMIGYGLGTGAFALARYLGMPVAERRARHFLTGLALALIGVQASLAIWAYVGWQNEIRRSFGMDSLSPLVWIVIVVVAGIVAAAVLILSRTVRLLSRSLITLLIRWLPRRLAFTLGTALTVGLLWWIASGAFVNFFFSASNWSFSARDLENKPGVTQPASELRSGSPASAAEWDDLGRQGRAFVAGGPTVEDLNAFSGGGAVEPIRVYVGDRSAETLEERADLVLAELQRTGAFDREVLVIATTTGTGFLDRNGVDAVEFLWNGDTAIAGVQYSYLPSWISLLADQEVVKETSRTVFRTVHDYWSTLPDDARPDIYLYGLSLGSTGVEAVLSSVDMLNEPISGALMVGPPFVNSMHRDLTEAREPGTPPWHPVVNGGRTVRFTSQEYGLDAGSAPWGPTRVIYLQHGSDPVVFFREDLAFVSPDWLEPGQRAPDVADRMAWYPLVTAWQVLLDLPAADTVPVGFGHLYTVESNVASWAAITSPETWSSNDTARLSAHIDAWHHQLDAAIEADA